MNKIVIDKLEQISCNQNLGIIRLNAEMVLKTHISICIDEEAVELAKQAFGNRLSEEKEKVLNSLIK